MIEWDSTFMCNHTEIDNQHKVLIGIINKISSIVETKNYELSKLVDIVVDLDIYIDEHFVYEENLMKKYHYTKAEQHIKEHNGMRLKMKDLNIYYIQNHKEFYYDTLMYLSNWLANHIMIIDKELTTYINGIPSEG